MPQNKKPFQYDASKPKRRLMYPNHYMGESGTGKQPTAELINRKEQGYTPTGIGAIDDFNRNAKIDELGPQAQYNVQQTAEYYKKNPAARKAQLAHTARAAAKNKPMSKLLKIK